jgi:hypothetical protein
LPLIVAQISLHYILGYGRLLSPQEKKDLELGDPSLQDGWAYFTAWKLYGPYTKTLEDQKEARTHL